MVGLSPEVSTGVGAGVGRSFRTVPPKLGRIGFLDPEELPEADAADVSRRPNGLLRLSVRSLGTEPGGSEGFAQLDEPVTGTGEPEEGVAAPEDGPDALDGLGRPDEPGELEGLVEREEEPEEPTDPRAPDEREEADELEEAVKGNPEEPTPSTDPDDEDELDGGFGSDGGSVVSLTGAISGVSVACGESSSILARSILVSSAEVISTVASSRPGLAEAAATVLPGLPPDRLAGSLWSAPDPPLLLPGSVLTCPPGLPAR